MVLLLSKSYAFWKSKSILGSIDFVIRFTKMTDSPFCNVRRKIKRKSLCRNINWFHLFSGSETQKTHTTVFVPGFEDKILQNNDVRIMIDCFSQVTYRLFHFIAIGMNTPAFTIKHQETETIFTEANGTFFIDLFHLTVALEQYLGHCNS